MSKYVLEFWHQHSNKKNFDFSKNNHQNTVKNIVWCLLLNLKQPKDPKGSSEALESPKRPSQALNCPQRPMEENPTASESKGKSQYYC